MFSRQSASVLATRRVGTPPGPEADQALEERIARHKALGIAGLAGSIAVVAGSAWALPAPGWVVGAVGGLALVGLSVGQFRQEARAHQELEGLARWRKNRQEAIDDMRALVPQGRPPKPPTL